MQKENYRPGLSKNQDLVKQLKEFQQNPRSLVFISLAENYRQEGLPSQALQILEEGLEQHPKLASALVAKGRCLLDLKRYSEALNELNAVLLENPQNIKALKLQSEIFVRLGQRKSAIRSLTKVVLAYPQDIEAARELEQLENIETKKIVPTERIFQVSSDAPPVSKPLQGLSAAGKIEDFQVEDLKSSLSSIPLEALQTPTNVSEAQEAEFQEVEDAEPTFATRTIAELYLRQGLKAKALAVVRKILKNEPENSWARETLQNLKSDGIVLPEKKVLKKDKAAFAKKAKVLEHMLVRAQLLKRINA